MNPRTPRGAAYLAFGLLVLAFVSYGALRAKNFLAGPSLTLETPKDGATLSESSLTVAGRAERIARLTLNGRQIFTNEAGFFRERLLLAPGYAIIEVQARDRFNRGAKVTRHVVFKNP